MKRIAELWKKDKYEEEDREWEDVIKKLKEKGI